MTSDVVLSVPPVDTSVKSSASLPSMEKVRLKPSSLLAALWPCLCYFLCSLAMNVLTKTLVTTFQWRSVYTLGAIQSIFTLASLTLLATARSVFAVVTGTKQHPSVEQPVETKRRGVGYVLRVLLPLMTLHLSNMLLGFASLRVVNLPMYLVLRRLTTFTPSEVFNEDSS